MLEVAWEVAWETSLEPCKRYQTKKLISFRNESAWCINHFEKGAIDQVEVP